MSLDSEIVTVHVLPDGSDSACYEQFETASRLRRAWECLIRIAEFRRACANVQAGMVGSSAVAKEWGLYAFKCCTEPFDVGREPRFSSSWVRMFVRKQGKRCRRIGLEKGQIAFVVDVEQMLRDPASMRAQLATLERRLTSRHAAMMKTGRPDYEAPLTRVVDRTFGACLQLNDLERSGHSAEQIKGIVQHLSSTNGKAPLGELPRGPSAEERANIDKRFFDLRKRSKKLINCMGYLALAAHHHASKATAAAPTTPQAVPQQY
jgi:hypothetical protein